MVCGCGYSLVLVIYLENLPKYCMCWRITIKREARIFGEFLKTYQQIKKVPVLDPLLSTIKVLPFSPQFFCLPFVYFLTNFNFGPWNMKGKLRKMFSILENANRSKSDKTTSKNHIG